MEIWGEIQFGNMSEIQFENMRGNIIWKYDGKYDLKMIGNTIWKYEGK